MTAATGVLFVPGKPAPQGSKRHVGRGILVESSKDVGPWRERVALAAHNWMCGQAPLSGAVEVRLAFVLPRPKATPKTKTPAATKRPDIDKLARAALDAMTSVCFLDDSQVVHLRITKRLGEIDEQPGVHISFEGVSSLNAETMPQATSHIDDLVGAVEEIRRLCAVADNDRGFINKAAVAEVLDRWCV